MPRPRSKDELLKAAADNYDKLLQMIDSMTDEELNTPFDFSADEKKKEAHWSRDKNLRDILIHLYEWHVLLLKWVPANLNGDRSPFLPEPYNWKTYGSMNIELWKKHQPTSLETAKGLLDDSHGKVMAMIERFTDDELFEKKHYCLTGTSNLGSYVISVTSSHYDWAIKKLKAHRKNLSK